LFGAAVLRPINPPFLFWSHRSAMAILLQSRMDDKSQML